MAEKRGEHALVAGASMAGLLAARVLSDHFERVTILERDEVTDEPVARKGQPHARHLHALLAQGFRVCERFFPDLRRDLQAGGAASGTWARSSMARLRRVPRAVRERHDRCPMASGRCWRPACGGGWRRSPT